MIRLSVLDQSPVRSGGTASDAINETVQLAQTAERLGYHRYWLAEHHSHGAFAGTSPEVLIGRIASTTETIRVGSGGVMLSHYSALKVAESFRVLETLYPGRIDLGLGRAPGPIGSHPRLWRRSRVVFATMISRKKFPTSGDGLKGRCLKNIPSPE